MSSSFGKKKPAAPQRENTQRSAFDPQAAQETVQAIYRITQTEPSWLERARMMRGAM